MFLRKKIASFVLTAGMWATVPMATFSQSVPAGIVTYSATAIHQRLNQPQTVGRITKSGQKMRLEFMQNEKNIVQILRPSEGVMYVLDPSTQTFIEIRGAAVPATADQGYTTPCPKPPIAICDRIGDDSVSGIQVERWALSDELQNKPMIVLWDATRRRALQQEFPDGSKTQLSFVAMEDLNGRQTEHWQITQSAPDQGTKYGEYWFDPQLRVVTLEKLPNGETRRLENIKVGPVDEAYFQVPVGWLPQITAPQATPRTSQ